MPPRRADGEDAPSERATLVRYAFLAGRAPAGADPAVAVALATAPAGYPTDAPLGARDAARRRATAEAVRRHLPALVEAPRAGRRTRRTAAAIDLALPGPGGEPTLRFAIYADRADVVLVVRRDDPELRGAFERVWRGLHGLEEVGLTVFDPQWNRLLDLQRDLEVVVGQFQAETVVAAPSRRPWWRFW